MGFVEKVKQVAGEMGDAAKKGASQVQTKVEQAQLRRRADDAARRLGYVVYRERTGGVTADDDVGALVAEIADLEGQIAAAEAAADGRDTEATTIDGPEVPPPAPAQAVEEATGE